MKRVLGVFFISALLWSCGGEKKSNMTVSGTIKGLKKGKLYLQQFKDSALINVDSVEFKGNGSFEFSHYLESPEVLYLYLDREDNNDINDRITLFAEPGEIYVNTSWKAFDKSPEIIGSKSHEKLEEFNEVISNFNIRELELTQVLSSEDIAQDSEAIDSIQKLMGQNIIRRYRYAVNFGLNNADSYATPYIMLLQAREANPKYLDSVYNGLSPKVVDSKYGKEFKAFLEKE